MRIDGVTPAATARRELRRGDPATAEYRDRSRFSPDGYILDLTREAMQRTGRGDMASARRSYSPPESYNETGGLAYYDLPEPPLKLEMPVEFAPDPEPENPPAPMVSFVAFDGMLRSV